MGTLVGISNRGPIPGCATESAMGRGHRPPFRSSACLCISAGGPLAVTQAFSAELLPLC